MNKKIVEVTNGVLKVEGEDAYFFSNGQYDLLIRKDNCADVVAKLTVSDGIVALSNVVGGELVVEDRVISCDMECDQQ